MCLTSAHLFVLQQLHGAHGRNVQAGGSVLWRANDGILHQLIYGIIVTLISRHDKLHACEAEGTFTYKMRHITVRHPNVLTMNLTP